MTPSLEAMIAILQLILALDDASRISMVRNWNRYFGRKEGRLFTKQTLPPSQVNEQAIAPIDELLIMLTPSTDDQAPQRAIIAAADRYDREHANDPRRAEIAEDELRQWYVRQP